MICVVSRVTCSAILRAWIFCLVFRMAFLQRVIVIWKPKICEFSGWCILKVRIIHKSANTKQQASILSCSILNLTYVVGSPVLPPGHNANLRCCFSSTILQTKKVGSVTDMLISISGLRAHFWTLRRKSSWPTFGCPSITPDRKEANCANKSSSSSSIGQHRSLVPRTEMPSLPMQCWISCKQQPGSRLRNTTSGKSTR